MDYCFPCTPHITSLTLSSSILIECPEASPSRSLPLATGKETGAATRFPAPAPVSPFPGGLVLAGGRGLPDLEPGVV